MIAVRQSFHAQEVQQIEDVAEDRLKLIVLDLRGLQSLVHLELSLMDFQLSL